MNGHTLFELCSRCRRPTIDVVDDECRTCGHRNRAMNPFELLVLLVAAVVFGGAVALAMGWF
ncbi:MAG: hypothetical protein KDB37_15775 [Ilumatobacter sp.]|nr:hypothetical protein [Ilumatobacter sp.]